MADHVKKILNRAYLEDKPYKDIVLHLEREMRLNGLGAPDETTLMPLNTIDAVVTEVKKEQQQRGNCFHCGKYGHFKVQCRRLKKDTTQQKRTMSTRTHQIPTSLTVTRAEKYTKLKTAGTELLRQRIQESVNVNSPSPPTISTNNSYPSRPPSQKTKIAAPTFWGKGRRGANTIEDCTNRCKEDFMTECNEEPTQEWQRRWNVGMILQYNARYPDDPKPLPYWITQSPDINDANSNVQCQNRKPTGFLFTIRVTAVIRGTNQQSMTQTPSPSRYRSQIHRNTQKRYHTSPH